MNQPWEEIQPSEYQTFSADYGYTPDPQAAYYSALERQQKLLSKTTCKIACGLLFLCLAVQGLAIGAEVLASGLDYRYGLSAGMLDFLTTLLPCLVADILGLLLLCALLKTNWKRLFQHGQPHTGALRVNGAFAGLTGSFLAMLVIMGMLMLCELFGYTIDMPTLLMPTDSTIAAICYLAYVCLLGPIFEELIFRGVILSALVPFHKGFAIVASALLFGVFHGNPLQIFTGFFVGLLLGFLTVECRSIYPAMIAHIFNNTFVTLPELLPFDPVLVETVWMAAYVAIAVVAGMFFVAFQLKRVHKLGRGQDSVMTYNQCMVRLASHPLMIVYWLFFAALCLLFGLFYLVEGSMF